MSNRNNSRSRIKFSMLTLGTIEAIVNKLGGIDGIRLFLSGQTFLKRSEILHYFTSVSLPAIERFVVGEHFLREHNPEVRLWLGTKFKTVFAGKIEEDIPATEIGIHGVLLGRNDPLGRTIERALDFPILTELGVTQAKITLAHLYYLLKLQSSGQKGALSVAGTTNTFYIPDAEGIIWPVFVSWHRLTMTWMISARHLGDERGIVSGGWVFSRVGG